jgi:hypothetical protein
MQTLIGGNIDDGFMCLITAREKYLIKNLQRVKIINYFNVLPQGLPLGRKLSQFFGRPGKLKFSLGN